LSKISSELLDILNNLRKDLDFKYNYDSDKNCFKCITLDVCKEAKEFLLGIGYTPLIIEGNYFGADKSYYPNFKGWTRVEILKFARLHRNNGYSSNRIGFQHYWLEIDGYIIDLVEDQFKTFPNNPKVSVYSKPNNNYKQRKVHG